MLSHLYGAGRRRNKTDMLAGGKSLLHAEPENLIMADQHRCDRGRFFHVPRGLQITNAGVSAQIYWFGKFSVIC